MKGLTYSRMLVILIFWPILTEAQQIDPLHFKKPHVKWQFEFGYMFSFHEFRQLQFDDPFNELPFLHSYYRIQNQENLMLQMRWLRSFESGLALSFGGEGGMLSFFETYSERPFEGQRRYVPRLNLNLGLTYDIPLGEHLHWRMGVYKGVAMSIERDLKLRELGFASFPELYARRTTTIEQGLSLKGLGKHRAYDLFCTYRFSWFHANHPYALSHKLGGFHSIIVGMRLPLHPSRLGNPVYRHF
ncbi:MAG: hypothetical protein ACK417_02840 [Bacteroidia bacterium]